MDLQLLVCEWPWSFQTFLLAGTLLAGNFSRLTLPSVIVLDTKFSSCKKNQKMS